jgi:integrase
MTTMAKSLTAAAIERIRPSDVKLEIRDGSTGLILLVQPSGIKSFTMRFRRPSGRHANLTLGRYSPDIEDAEKPTIGQPLSLAMARVLAAEVRRQRSLGIDVVANVRVERQQRRSSYRGRDAVLFGQAVIDFIEGHHAKGTNRKPRDWREVAKRLGLKYPADGGEPVTIKKGLADRWRDRAVTEINGDDVFHVVQESIKDGIPGLRQRRTKAISKSRGRKMAASLGCMFGWLHGKRRIVANPCDGMDKQGAPPSRKRVLNVKTAVRNADELRWFWAAADEVGSPFGSMCKLLLLTGCRLNEIARMTKSELSDDLAMLMLPGGRTKNGLPHDVPLPDLARAILRELPRHAGPFIFSTTDGLTPFVSFGNKKALDAAMSAEAGQEVAPWVIHDLRRTAATGMASLGVLPHVIEACLNHVSGAAKGGVAGTYNQEQYNPEKKIALERWADHISSIIDETPEEEAKVVPMRKGRT